MACGIGGDLAAYVAYPLKQAWQGLERTDEPFSWGNIAAIPARFVLLLPFSYFFAFLC